MRVKAKEKYFDLELNRSVNAGEEFEVSNERGKALTTAANRARRALCEEVAAPTPTTEKVAVKKPRAKKEA